MIYEHSECTVHSSSMLFIPFRVTVDDLREMRERGE